MENEQRFRKAIEAFDEANSQDPEQVEVGGESVPGELLYARRMSEWLDRVEPEATEALRLAARCQHIERWKIPRDDYPSNRPGYIRWRNDLKKFHARRAGEILAEVGYDESTIGRVKDLVMKKGLKKDPETQALEDVICLVFMEHYLDEFSQKHKDEKLRRILAKTWRKMSPQGHKLAGSIVHSQRVSRLLREALA